MGAARSLDQTALRPCHQKNPSNDVKHITHMQSVLAKNNGNVHIKRRPCANNMTSLMSKK